jgi:hypothetical protein
MQEPYWQKAQQGYNNWPRQGPNPTDPASVAHMNELQAAQALQQPLPTTHYALRLSDDDVQRIAEAVVARLKADWPQR